MHQLVNNDSPSKSGIAAILDSLDRWSRRFIGHFNQKRSCRRIPYRTEILVYVPDAEEKAGESDDGVAIKVWSRNLSKGGLGFVHHELVPQDDIIVCLRDAERKCKYLSARIVRRRQIQEGFWEYGATFQGHADL